MSAGRMFHGLGGVCMSVGSMRSAHALEHRLVLRQRVRVLRENLLTSRCVISLSGPIMSDRPSGNGENDDGLRGSSSKPNLCSSSSLMISGRSRLLT